MNDVANKSVKMEAYILIGIQVISNLIIKSYLQAGMLPIILAEKKRKQFVTSIN